jgi:hypothetical protein
MSHQLRHEKDCLNCGAIIEDRYCTRCGQENLPVKESFGHLFRHFFEDITHYDSKLLTTLKDLLFKPGFLTQEYLQGRRTKYLHPIRMYVFISFVYFLAMAYFTHPSRELNEFIVEKAAQDERIRILDSLHLPVVHKHPVVHINIFGNVTSDVVKTYDSLQQALPAGQKNKGLKTWVFHHWSNTIQLYGEEGAIVMASEKTAHVIPKLMFLLLPLFAWVMKLFYGRRYYYAEHAIFTLHLHAAVFIIFFFALPFHSSVVSIVEYLLVLLYFTIALRVTYRQSLGVTIAKALGIAVVYFLFMSLGIGIAAFTALL